MNDILLVLVLLLVFCCTARNEVGRPWGSRAGPSMMQSSLVSPYIIFGLS